MRQPIHELIARRDAEHLTAMVLTTLFLAPRAALGSGKSPALPTLWTCAAQ